MDKLIYEQLEGIRQDLNRIEKRLKHISWDILLFGSIVVFCIGYFYSKM